MWKALDRIVSAIICRLFKPKYHVERVERYQLPGRLRIVKWCAAPADAPEDELRRIFSIVDEPQCDDMVVWFYSSLEDIGRNLNNGRNYGPRYFNCNNAPSNSNWNRRARLSLCVPINYCTPFRRPRGSRTRRTGRLATRQKYATSGGS